MNVKDVICRTAKFEYILGGSELTPESEGIVIHVAKLLGVLPEELSMSLTTRIMMTTKGGGMGTLYK